MRAAAAAPVHKRSDHDDDRLYNDELIARGLEVLDWPAICRCRSLNQARVMHKPTTQQAHSNHGPCTSCADTLLRGNMICTENSCASMQELASFCETSMGVSVCLNAKIPIGTSLERCQILQNETDEASDCDLDLHTVLDVTPVLHGLSNRSESAGRLA